MTSFKVRKISKKKKKSKKQSLLSILGVFKNKKVIIGVLVVGFIGIAWAGSAFFQSDFVKGKTRNILTGDALKHDSFGHTNILFLGVGGKMAEGGNLSDSVMIVSIDPKGPSASALSLPRDLFVSTDDEKIGDRKLNEVYAKARYIYGDEKGLNFAKKVISDFTGMEIDYAVVVDFNVFVDIIDFIGGFEIYVPKAIEDPFYPGENYSYQTFVVRKGLQRFDGETALKYARSRKTSSDYSRATRQQSILFALQKELAKEGRLVQMLQDKEGIKQLYDSYKERVNTDVSLKDMIGLARLSVAIDADNITTSVINDDPRTKGGLLYTPAKEFFGGQFVLIPEDLQDTQLFVRMNLLNPDILKENAQISVLNGSQTEGKASRNAARLRRIGFHIIDTGNYEAPNGKPVAQTFLRNLQPGKNALTIELLKDMYNIAEVVDAPEAYSGTDLVDLELVIGYN